MTDVVDTEKGSIHGRSSDAVSQQVYERPTGLKGFYYHPLTQTSLLGFVCFMCPGLFNALNGLGGGGQVDNTTGANSNAAVYATFAFFAFFAGSINNKLGSRTTLMLGTTGYALYVGSYLAINIHPGAKGFVIAAGAILGICAGLLWTAQGALMMAYPTEGEKGKYIGVFWTIFNLGGVVGASVALGQNFQSKANSAKMIRTDGTKVATIRQPSWKSEFFGLYVALRTDPMILFLFPMFLASNWFYTWQFNDYNGAIFNIRARALRLLRTYTRASIPPESERLDIFSPGYTGKIFLYIFCGILDAMWQTNAYWLMGAMSNDPAKLAYFAGFYKSLQSAGAAGMWRADAVLIPYMNIFVSTWALLVAGLIFVLPMIHLRVKDHTEPQDDNLEEKVAEI
ncbi:UN protein [Termitomyces sp. J132]|nr:UN protein [Termitomyces sp. J132]